MSKKGKEKSLGAELRRYIPAFLGGSVLYLSIITIAAGISNEPVTLLVCNSALAFGTGMGTVAVQKWLSDRK